MKITSCIFFGHLKCSKHLKQSLTIFNNLFNFIKLTYSEKLLGSIMTILSKANERNNFVFI